MRREGNDFHLRYGVYFPGDPNCCPCATIEVMLELGPDALRVLSVERVPGREPGCLEKIRGDVRNASRGDSRCARRCQFSPSPSNTERMFPAGSVNQATLGPGSPRWTPRSSVL